MGLVFQDSDVQLFCPSVFDEIAFGPLQLGMAKGAILEAVNKALELFDIGHLRERSPHHLSGEEEACCLGIGIGDGSDSAASGRTDSRAGSAESDEDGCSRWHAPGRSIVFATHDLHLVSQIADECVVLDHGQVLAAGTPAQIVNDPELLHRANLIASTALPQRV